MHVARPPIRSEILCEPFTKKLNLYRVVTVVQLFPNHVSMCMESAEGTEVCVAEGAYMADDEG